MPEIETVASDLEEITQIVAYLRRSRTQIFHARNLARRDSFKGLVLDVKTNLLALKTKLSGVPVQLSKPSIEKIDDLVVALDDLHKDINRMPLQTIESELDLIQRIFAAIRGILPSTWLTVQVDLPTILPSIHRSIRSEVKRDFEEVVKCYSVQAYRPSMVFCGRIAEVVLRRKYYEKKRRQGVAANEIESELEHATLGQVIGKCRDLGLMDDVPGLNEYSGLVNRLRVPSVHANIASYDPGPDATKGAISFTLALIRAVH